MNFLVKWKQRLEERKLWEVFIYLFFGVLTTIVNIAVHFTCLDVFGWHYMVATVVSWVVSILFAFVTNKRWVFHSKTETSIEWVMEFSKFVFYRLLSLVMDMGSMYVLIELIHTGDIVAKIFTQVLVVVANYVFSKFLIFTRK
ncbi:GtrA family protein [Enterococcus saccharolyticus]|uniref:GtrA/DPMS transmembrane domain-containing protein n=1 Tax=Enterococcus saccharolyticus subsp. saccharolyticus ATCC 43076 TaxID=1139996 RepID=S0NSB8_9ENTE|nr:GtrA family protein [Enterococcus saccharolyticus]EOT29640.1 hypothetical protein OMQ_00952 [Enterococcus saccharolyticus subsp. saccharolyticus ATCC 43076]EOT80800.1 hypothetical protein I572_01331 [Enterococcus saccharolyticus subsp. saccharolyticus ATCC 43076]OJG86200.1 hypothetical protein RV16_GL001201 [Enterococcus saccharolyticus]